MADASSPLRPTNATGGTRPLRPLPECVTFWPPGRYSGSCPFDTLDREGSTPQKVNGTVLERDPLPLRSAGSPPPKSCVNRGGSHFQHFWHTLWRANSRHESCQCVCATHTRKRANKSAHAYTIGLNEWATPIVVRERREGTAQPLGLS